MMLALTLTAAACGRNGGGPAGAGAAQAGPEAAITSPGAGIQTKTAEAVLTVTGEGVEHTRYYSLEDLKQVTGGYREETYSMLNAWPTKSSATAIGVDLRALLSGAGVLPGATRFKVESADGYFMHFTPSQLLGERYCYPGLRAGSEQGAVEVKPILAWALKSGPGGAAQAREEDLRLMLGQAGLNDANAVAMVKAVTKITVSLGELEQWGMPAFSLEDGGFLAISHEDLDQVKIYYTTDGTEPDVRCAVYNPSATYFQPALNRPVPLDGVAVVKAVAVGFGREDSETAVFEAPAPDAPQPHDPAT